MNKVKKISLICILIFLFILYSLNSAKLNVYSPDEVVLKLYSLRYSTTGDIFFSINEFSSDYSPLRGTYVLEDKVVPLKFLGFVIFFGGLTSLIPWLLFYLTAI